MVNGGSDYPAARFLVAGSIAKNSQTLPYFPQDLLGEPAIIVFSRTWRQISSEFKALA
jgi:hypothetical protein